MAMPVYLRQTLLPLLLCISGSAWATQPSLLVGLHIQNDRIALQYAAAVRETDFTRLDLLWYEPLTSWLDGSVKLGIIDVTQDSNPIPAGQSTSGNTLSLALRLHLYRGDYLKLHADMTYQYADTSADLTGQTVEMRWHQISGQVGADIRLVQYTYLTLAAGTIAIDGHEYATGTTNSVQSFQSNKQAFGHLGILIGVDPTSHIGIEVSAGAVSGGRIFFQRWF